MEQATKKFLVALSQVQSTFKRILMKFKQTFFSNGKSSVGMIILLIFILIGIFGPLIWPYDPEVVYENHLASPSWEHLLGTDNIGRDVFRQLVAGTNDVLAIAFYTAIISISVGVIFGLISGFAGGIADRIIQMITNVFLTIPSLPIFLILASLFTIRSSLGLALILSLFSWAGLCRSIRAQVMTLKERDFIQICQVMNLSKAHIIFKEIMPNVASYILVNFILAMKNAITGSVGIMILGLAAFEPTNWGAILVTAKDYGALIVPEARIWLFSPIVCIALFQLSAILLSNGLDETFNPRLRRN
ncbi:MAG: ABC transporter permease [Bacilli bacterium]|jgi:peptide/nickel transport system permease protein|nr:ABC transporter permease [Bacilli bacterium]